MSLTRLCRASSVSHNFKATVLSIPNLSESYATWRSSGSHKWISSRLREWFTDPFHAIGRLDLIFTAFVARSAILGIIEAFSQSLTRRCWELSIPSRDESKGKLGTGRMLEDATRSRQRGNNS